MWCEAGNKPKVNKSFLVGKENETGMVTRSSTFGKAVYNQVSLVKRVQQHMPTGLVWESNKDIYENRTKFLPGSTL